MAPYVPGQLATLGEGLPAHSAVIGPVAGVSPAVGGQGMLGQEVMVTKLAGKVRLEGAGLREGRRRRWRKGRRKHQASGGAAGVVVIPLSELPEPHGKVQGLHVAGGGGGGVRLTGASEAQRGGLEGRSEGLAQVTRVECGRSGLVRFESSLSSFSSPSSSHVRVFFPLLLVDAEGVDVLSVL